MWTNAHRELMTVTLTPRAATRKDRTTAGARMDLQEMGLFVKVRIPNNYIMYRQSKAVCAKCLSVDVTVAIL